MRRLLLLLALLPLTTGCVVGSVAKTAVDVATLPVKVVGKGVDAALPSQKKADQKRGRELRKQDEARGRAARRSPDQMAADAEADWITQCRQLSALGRPCPPPPAITPVAPDPRSR